MSKNCYVEISAFVFYGLDTECEGSFLIVILSEIEFYFPCLFILFRYLHHVKIVCTICVNELLD